MKNQIETLRVCGKRLQETLEALASVETQQTEITAALGKAVAQLTKLPPESLSIPEADGKPFTSPTARLLQSRDNLKIKLDLIPGIRVRMQADEAGLRRQVRVGVNSLMKQGRELASEQLEALRQKLQTDMLAHCGGDPDRAKAAAADVLPKSEAQKWADSFRDYYHCDDPLKDIESAIGIAESFLRGEPAD